MKLYGRLSALASDITTGLIKPMDQQEEVYSIFNKRLKAVDAQFKKFMNVEVKTFNEELKKSELQILLDKKIKSYNLTKYLGIKKL